MTRGGPPASALGVRLREPSRPHTRRLTLDTRAALRLAKRRRLPTSGWLASRLGWRCHACAMAGAMGMPGAVGMRGRAPSHLQLQCRRSRASILRGRPQVVTPRRVQEERRHIAPPLCLAIGTEVSSCFYSFCGDELQR